ncbi:hypothetical protein SERLADRAFT_402307 [Serpula lacrymans var. lacrymans S7.9]|nr:uncharacterized protein SERLADRAFT_402307 [Serpula lacrymans var. lacrymans S7.9]EGO19682.1 hypothetical protein SERLADRAFT_402307 [Serpula lacrymans var. lacrymans S7.9]
MSSYLAASMPMHATSSMITPNSSHLSDPTSPESFKQNIRLALTHVARVNSLAKRALGGIENAYHPGTSNAHTDADLTSLAQAMSTLSDFLRTTGVGALPLVPTQGSSDSSLTQASSAVTEQELTPTTTQSVQSLYERLQRSQESAGAVVSLLGSS